MINNCLDKQWVVAGTMILMPGFYSRENLCSLDALNEWKIECEIFLPRNEMQGKITKYDF